MVGIQALTGGSCGDRLATVTHQVIHNWLGMLSICNELTHQWQRSLDRRGRMGQRGKVGISHTALKRKPNAQRLGASPSLSRAPS